MTTQFPTALDALTNPVSTDPMNSATVPHAEQHANANDAIEALQAKVGIDGSADSSSLDYRVAAVEVGKETAGAAAAAVGAHESAIDPHPQYLTPAEASAAYVNVGGDDMTGPLNITAGTTPQVLTVTGSYKEGEQLIPNSEFADNSAWTLGGGWIIDGGKLKNPTAGWGNLAVNVTGLTPGASYVVEFGVDADYAFFVLQATGYPAQSYWRSWESVKHIGYIADAGSITLNFLLGYVTAPVQIDHIRMYKVAANSERVLRGASGTAPTFDLVASGTSFGLGQDSLKFSANAVGSVAIGSGALKSSVRPYEAIAIGVDAMGNSPSPTTGIAIGRDALRYLRDAYDNVAIGAWGTMAYAIPGVQNTAIGTYSLSTCTGSGNATLGYGALQSVQAGNNNVGIGNAVGHYMNGGSSNNTLVGALCLGSGSPNQANSSMTGLGYNAFNLVPYSNSMCLGSGSAVTGTYQNQIGASGTTTYAYGAVQDRSDRRDKSDIRPTILGLDFIKALTPVDFKWDMRDDYRAEIPEALSDRLHFLAREKRGIKEAGGDVTAIKAEIDDIEAQIAAIAQGNLLDNIVQDGRKKRTRYHHGLIAQDVRKAMNDLGVDFGGFQNHKINGGQDALSIGYTELIAPMIKAIQQQQEMIEALQAQVEALTP